MEIQSESFKDITFMTNGFQSDKNLFHRIKLL